MLCVLCGSSEPHPSPELGVEWRREKPPEDMLATAPRPLTCLGSLLPRSPPELKPLPHAAFLEAGTLAKRVPWGPVLEMLG